MNTRPCHPSPRGRDEHGALHGIVRVCVRRPTRTAALTVRTRGSTGTYASTTPKCTDDHAAISAKAVARKRVTRFISPNAPQRVPQKRVGRASARHQRETRVAGCPVKHNQFFARSPAGSWPVKACSRSTPSGRLCTCVAASAARVCGPPHPRAHASTRDRHQAGAGTRSRLTRADRRRAACSAAMSRPRVAYFYDRCVHAAGGGVGWGGAGSLGAAWVRGRGRGGWWIERSPGDACGV